MVGPPPAAAPVPEALETPQAAEGSPGSLSQRLAKSPAEEVDSLERVGVMDTKRQPETIPSPKKPSTAQPAQSEWPDAALLLANEQTFLSWVRTSATLMLAGVLLASLATDFEENLKQIVSITLVAIGMFCGVFGWLAWRRNLSAIQRGRQAATARLLGLLALAIIIVGAGLVAGIWLATQ